MGKCPKINFFAKLILWKPENNFLKRKASKEILKINSVEDAVSLSWNWATGESN